MTKENALLLIEEFITENSLRAAEEKKHGNALLENFHSGRAKAYENALSILRSVPAWPVVPDEAIRGGMESRPL